MTVAFYPPFENSLNEYTTSVIKAIHLAGKDVKVIPFPTSMKGIVMGKIGFDIAWLNWFENPIATNFVYYKELLLKILVILSLKLHKVKIYVVFHNKRPHDVSHSSLSFWFYKFLLKKADKIIVLSDRSRQEIKKLVGPKALEKVVKISHPAYELRTKESKPSKFTVLFFGALRAYKNVELIFRLAKKFRGIEFLMAGNPSPSDYGEELKKLAAALSNVKLILGFQSDSEIEKLIDESSIVLLPYNKKSSLNSGSVFHAFSKGINVIVPDIATVDEFENKGLIYCYDYSDEADHYTRLEKTVERAYGEFMEDPDAFYKKAEALQKEVSKFSPEYLAKQIKEAHLL